MLAFPAFGTISTCSKTSGRGKRSKEKEYEHLAGFSLESCFAHCLFAGFRSFCRIGPLQAGRRRSHRDEGAGEAPRFQGRRAGEPCRGLEGVYDLRRNDRLDRTEREGRFENRRSLG